MIPRPRGRWGPSGLWAAVLAAFALAVLLPAVASAHAILQESTPQRGETLRQSPEQIRFEFNEPVETSFGAVRLFDSDGEQIDTGEVLHPGGEPSAIAVDVDGALEQGSYTAVYRVVSADSHPVSGGLTFSVGSPDGGGAPVSELIGAESGSQPDSPAFVADRWLGYASTALMVGGIVFLLAVWRPVLARRSRFAPASLPFETRMRRILRISAVVGLLASLASLPIQAATAAGVPLLDGLDSDLLGDVIGTRYGTIALLRSIAWAAIVFYVFLAPRTVWSRSGNLLGALTVPAALLVVAPALSGHASTQGPTALLVPAATLHVAAMAVWLGGLVALLAAVPRGTGALETGERPALLGDLLGRFPPIALWSVIALAAGGIVQAVVEVGSFPALVEDGFGRAVLVKAALLLALAGLGWHNRNRLIPAIARIAGKGDADRGGGAEPAPPTRTLGSVGRRLRANLRAETGLIAAALVAAALMVGYQPPADEASGPISGSETLTGIGDALLEYTIEPGSQGPNAVHLYLFDGQDGSPRQPREITASISLPEKEVGPLELDLRRSGPGHYTAPNADFTIPGDWELTIAVRTSKFDQDETKIEVRIN